MSDAKKITCPNCGEDCSLFCIGKRNALYPAGCFQILGLPLSMLHQISSPIDYRCKSCDERFGVRGVLAKIALVTIFSLIPLFVLYVAISILVW